MAKRQPDFGGEEVKVLMGKQDRLPMSRLVLS